MVGTTDELNQLMVGCRWKPGKKWGVGERREGHLQISLTRYRCPRNHSDPVKKGTSAIETVLLLECH